jgi:hypothetical protein
MENIRTGFEHLLGLLPGHFETFEPSKSKQRSGR